MKRLLALLALLPVLAAQGAQIWTVNSVADPTDPLIPVIWINAASRNSNVFAVYGETWGDGNGGMWTFKAGDATPTNTIALGGPVESANPLSPAGRWFKTMSASSPGGTNYYNTLIVTNLYITTNVFVINGTTNAAGLWVNITNILQPADLTWQPMVQLPWVVGTNTIAAYGTPSTESFVSYRDLVEDTWNPLYVGVSSNTVQLSTVSLVPRDTSASVDTQLSQYGYGLSMITRTNFQGFIWGGTTNVLYRTATGIAYTNGAANVSFSAINGSAQQANYGVSAGGVALMSSSAGVAFNNGTTEVDFFGSSFSSPNSNISLGTSANLWAGVHMTNAVGTGTNYIYFGTNTLSVSGTDLYWNQTKLN